MNISVFNGICIDEKRRILCSEDINELKMFWKGVKNISDWIKYLPDDQKNEEYYDEALLAVERFENWNNKINRNRKIFVPEKVLNDLFKPAVDYAIKYGMAEQTADICKVTVVE